MGAHMEKVTNFAQHLWKDESGQGTAEYVLLLAIVAGVLLVFGKQIKGMIMSKLSSVEGQMGAIGGE